MEYVVAFAVVPLVNVGLSHVNTSKSTRGQFVGVATTGKLNYINLCTEINKMLTIGASVVVGACVVGASVVGSDVVVAVVGSVVPYGL